MIKQLLDSVFVISGIIKVTVSVISLSLGLQLTLSLTLITLDITKTSSNNNHCLIFGLILYSPNLKFI